MSKLVIAIDGPAGSGKSTLARRVAALLGYLYLDSGAVYRALAWKALRNEIPLDAADRLEALARTARVDLVREADQKSALRVLLDGEDVTAEIRSAQVGQAASRIAIIPGVRVPVVDQLRRMGRSGGVVMEGRDIGTVVFPGADLKVYLDASVEVRAERRLRDYQAQGRAVELSQVIDEVRERDRRDQEREASPLTRTADAVVVDNSAMTAEETARLIAQLARAGGAE